MKLQPCLTWVNLLSKSLRQKKATKNLANNLLVNRVVAIASAAIGLTAIQTNPLQATTLNWNFQVYITNGSLAGNTYSGSFSYDDSSLTGVGFENLGVANGLRISLNWLGQPFTERNDIQFPNFPTVSFDEGNLLTLNWVVADFSSGFSIGRDQQRSRLGFTYNNAAIGEGFGDVTYSRTQTSPDPRPQPVSASEPSIAVGLCVVGLGLLLKKKVASSTPT